jgi:hypothetical protein
MAKIQAARDIAEDDRSSRNGTPVLAQLARLLGRVAARQWLSNRTTGGESDSEEQQKASGQGPGT